MENKRYAPIVIFAFNRVEVINKLIDSLLTNAEAPESDLYVYVDGPRANKHEDSSVHAVQNCVRNIKGFKSITYSFSETNKGLGNSIIKGVTEVINKHGKAIIVEDDLVCSANFLAFMNEGLDKYKKDNNVFSISGYTNIVKFPKGYDYDAYACVRSSSWGWATWKDRWDNVDWELKDWDTCKKNKKAFNKWGGSDCFGMLEGWKEGRNKSWAIRFCYNQFINNKVSIFPTISKIANEGFDGKGTNCKKYSRFKCIFDDSVKKDFKMPTDTTIIKSIKSSAISYHSIPKRIYSKIMYIIQE